MATITITRTDQPEKKDKEIAISMTFDPVLKPNDDETPAQALAGDIANFIFKRAEK